MSLIKEFKEFAIKGNVTDMAVGVIIGAAFGKIITSLVNDIVMPPLGKLVGGINFSDLYISLDPQKTEGIISLAKAKETGAALIAYGQFLNTVFDFLLVALSIFAVIKIINNLKRKQPVPMEDPTRKTCPFCISSIALQATRCAYCTAEL